MRNTLEDHLSALREAGKIRTWHDLELEAGTEWEPAILEKLDTADIILLLVSRNFIASKYCYGTELKRAIARHNAGTARVIPVILRHCDWNHDYVPFSKLNVLPTHAKPITSWVDPDEAFAIVAQKIRETVTQLAAKKLAVRQAEEREQQQRLAQQKIAELAKQERLQRERQAAEAAEQRQQELEQMELASEKGVDYSRLRDLLKAGKWQEADQETAAIMIRLSGGESKGRFQLQSISNFPCRDLLTINKLWQEYSQNKFGFTVQKNIWSSSSRNFEDLAERVGWQINSTWLKEQDLKLSTGQKL